MDPDIILFDEPTSALDPTMIGEVLSVIRALARQGLTMMIVTHEMKFARDVSNRIFYMDEGIVYEEGTPQQIFEAPQKDKTRQFVNRLKVFSCRITARDFDYIALNSQLTDFAGRHDMARGLTNNLVSAVEELCVQTILPQQSGEFCLEIQVEYSEDTGLAVLDVSIDGEPKDYLQEADPISAALIRHAAAEIRYTCEGVNRYHITMKQPGC